MRYECFLLRGSALASHLHEFRDRLLEQQDHLVHVVGLELRAVLPVDEHVVAQFDEACQTGAGVARGPAQRRPAARRRLQHALHGLHHYRPVAGKHLEFLFADYVAEMLQGNFNLKTDMYYNFISSWSHCLDQRRS